LSAISIFSSTQQRYVGALQVGKGQNWLCFYPFIRPKPLKAVITIYPLSKQVSGVLAHIDGTIGTISLQGALS